MHSTPHRVIPPASGLRGSRKFKLLIFFCPCVEFSVIQVKAFETFLSPKFGVTVVVKNRHEVLVQRVQVEQCSRDTQGDLDSPWEEIQLLYCDLDVVSRLLSSIP